MRQIGLLFLLLLAACSDPLITRAEEAVRRLLRDPESAQFRDVERCAKPNAVRGEVNARNGFGGYTGFTPFFYVDGRAAVLSSDHGIGRYTSFDADLWDELQRLCYSDEVMKAVDRDQANFMNSLDEPINSAAPAGDARPTAGPADEPDYDLDDGDASEPAGDPSPMPERPVRENRPSTSSTNEQASERELDRRLERFGSAPTGERLP